VRREISVLSKTQYLDDGAAHERSGHAPFEKTENAVIVLLFKFELFKAFHPLAKVLVDRSNQTAEGRQTGWI
jgi:hypothetical protein